MILDMMSHGQVMPVAAFDEQDAALPIVYPDNNTLDHLWESPQDQTLWPAMEQYLQTYIAAFEPRLKNPKVSIEAFHPKDQVLEINIQGQLRFGKQVEVLTFPLALDVKGPGGKV